MRQTSISASEAAAELGLSPQAARDLIRKGKLVGRKDAADRWLIDLQSVERYIIEHGRKETPGSRMQELERKLEQLGQRVDDISAASTLAAKLAAVERERDKFRSEAVTMREVAHLLSASGSDMRAAAAKLLEASDRELRAVAQLLGPADATDLMPIEER